jgi:AraC-like DNA-binding protein
MKVSDIALCCGFADQSHFTRVFKGVVNLTPGKFRYLLNNEPLAKPRASSDNDRPRPAGSQMRFH